MIRWPVKATVLHPHRFPSAAENEARTSAEAVVNWHKSEGIDGCDLQQHCVLR